MVIAVKHHMNPRHVYCRLRDIGIRKGPAIFLCQILDKGEAEYRMTKIQNTV
jgi:hypothetical protein